MICGEYRGEEEVLRAHNLASKSPTLFVSKELGEGQGGFKRSSSKWGDGKSRLSQ